MITRYLVLAAATCSALIAILHIYIIARGASAYRDFGAGEMMTSLAENGSWFPALLTSAITIIFFIFAAWYLAGIGLLPAPPYLRAGLIAIAGIYTLRGIIVLPALLFGMPLSFFDIWSSFTSLAIGLLHCAATWLLLSSK